MKFSIITLFTISSLLFIQPTQSTLPVPGLIEHVCRLTPHYHLCVLTLKSHAFARKITSQHDVSAFAKITLKVIAAKTPVILATLRTIHEQCEQPEFKLALEGCISSYTKISLDILPKALGCVDKGDLDGIKQHALTTANLAASCQQKCNAFTASSFSAFANSGFSSAGSTKTDSSSTGAGSINTGSTKTGSSSTGSGSINTGSSSAGAGSINTGSSAAGSINTGSSSAGSTKTGSSATGSINTGSSSVGSSKTGSSSAGSTNTGSSASAGSAKTGSSSASGTGSTSAIKPAVKAAAKVVGDSNVYVQNMCAITVSIVTKVSASKQTILTS